MKLIVLAGALVSVAALSLGVTTAMAITKPATPPGSCPAGQAWNGSRCVPLAGGSGAGGATMCATGTAHLKTGGMCVTKPAASYCPTGQTPFIAVVSGRSVWECHAATA